MLNFAVELPGLRHRPHVMALCVVLGLALAHVAATWGAISNLWGDSGLWLHEVERFAQGDVPYRDFTWPYPPMALWLVGGVAKILGTQVAVLWLSTSVIFGLICLTFLDYVSALLQHSLVLPVATGSLLLALAYANQMSAPLPTGMYTPAAPLGFLFFLAGLAVALRLLHQANAIRAATVGLLSACCILTKQDFWIPALYLTVVVCWLQARSGVPGLRLAFLTALVFAVSLLLGLILLWIEAGLPGLLGVWGGSGQVAENYARAFPSWQRFTAELAALGILSGGIGALLYRGALGLPGRARHWISSLALVGGLASFVHVLASHQIGLRLRARGLEPFPGNTAAYMAQWADTDHRLWLGSLAWLKASVQTHLLPFLLPVALALLLLLYRRRLPRGSATTAVFFLLGACVTARLRRGFEYVEWYHFLLEIPVYVLVLWLFLPSARDKLNRGYHPLFVALIVAGLYSYWSFGVGPFTRRGMLLPLKTPRGIVHVDQATQVQFEKLWREFASLDPTRNRPLFAFGEEGPFDYFLDRKNPSPLTTGFRLSSFSPDKVVADLQNHDPPILALDYASYFEHMGAPARALSLDSWDLKMMQNSFTTFDLRYFREVVAHCKVVDVVQTPPRVFTIYDCSP